MTVMSAVRILTDTDAGGASPIERLMPSGRMSGRMKAALLIGLVAGFVTIVVEQCFKNNFPFDFAYFHAAGRTWAAGMDPYGPVFARFALPYIPTESALWLYPPQWWSITVALASMPIGTAAIVWKAIGVAALSIGGALLFDALTGAINRGWLMTGVIFAAVLSSADAAWITLRIGQSSWLVLLGFGLLLHGLRYNGTMRVTAGLVILLLKPQFGFFFVLLLASMPSWRRAAAAAVAITCAACLPLLFTLGLTGTVESAFHFLANTASYDSQPWNRPGSLTGVSFVAVVLGLPPVSPLIAIIAACAVSGLLCRRANNAAHVEPVEKCLIGLAAFYAMVPLHNYDLILLPAYLLTLKRLENWAACLIGMAALITWRASSFAFAIYGEELSKWKTGVFAAAFSQALVGTLAVALVLLAVGWGRREPLG